jgi:hypothetical protein
VVHHVLVPWWRGYDPYLHQEEVDEGEEVQGQDLPRLGRRALPRRSTGPRSRERRGSSAREAGGSAHSVSPRSSREAPFSGPVPLEEYVKWYFGGL